MGLVGGGGGGGQVNNRGSWLLLCNTSLLTNLCKLVCSTPLLLPSSLQTLASYKEQSRVGDVNDNGDHDYDCDYAF